MIYNPLRVLSTLRKGLTCITLCTMLSMVNLGLLTFSFDGFFGSNFLYGVMIHVLPLNERTKNLLAGSSFLISNSVWVLTHKAERRFTFTCSVVSVSLCYSI